MSKNMENQTKGILMKSRSASACIKEGYGLYTKRFKDTLKSSWQMALLYSIICSAMGIITVIFFPVLSVQTVLSQGNLYPVVMNNIPVLVAFLAIMLIGGVTEVATYSCAISLLKGNGPEAVATRKPKWLKLDIKAFWRTLKAALATTLVFAVVGGVLTALIALVAKEAQSDDNINAAVAVVMVVAAAVFIASMSPLAFTSTKYLFQDEARFWKLLGKDYAMAFRHLGFILVVVIVSVMVVFIAEYVLAQPAVVLSVANFQANIGVLNGDPLGMPGHIKYISAAVFLIAGFIQVYIRMSVIFTLYFMYGSIETQEVERKEYKEKATGENKLLKA